MSLLVNGIIAFLVLAFAFGLLFLYIIKGLAGREFRISRRAFLYSLAIPVVLGVVFLGIFAFFEYHETPEFCGKMCHSMEPLYESYTEPKNNTLMRAHLEEEAGCTGCHVGPGWTGLVESFLVVPNEFYAEAFNTYDRDDLGGELREDVCLKCHDGEHADEPGLVEAFGGEMVDPHTKDTGCGDCHEAHKSSRGLSMDTCTICHGLHIPDFEGAVEKHGQRVGEDCMVCHDRLHPEDARVHFDTVEGMTGEFCQDCHVLEYDLYYNSSTEASLELYGDCLNCHLDHERADAFHVSYAPYDNCSGCHPNYDKEGGFHDRTGVTYLNFEGFVEDDLCQRCHGEEVENLDANKQHRGLECNYCHADHQRRLVVFSECTVCHEDRIPSGHDPDMNCARGSCHGRDWYHEG